MNVEKAPFLAAAVAAGISPGQAAALWDTLQSPEAPATPPPVTFSVANVAYYFGGFIVIGAMTFFMTLGWATMGAPFICVMSVIYAIGLAALGWFLYRREDARVAGGVLVTAAVCMTPLAIYGFQEWHHLWLDGDPGTYNGFFYLVHGSWVWMELGTIAAAAIALRFVRFPLLTLPAAFAVWFLSLDLTNALFGHHYNFDAMQRLGLIFGTGMLAFSIWLDRRGWGAYAFWTYLFGAFTFYFGLALLWNGEAHEAIFAGICLLMVLLSIVLQRRVLIVFGALGIAAYLGHLAWDVFSASILFPFALTILGLAIVGAGILYQRKETQIRAAILRLLPAR